MVSYSTPLQISGRTIPIYTIRIPEYRMRSRIVNFGSYIYINSVHDLHMESSCTPRSFEFLKEAKQGVTTLMYCRR